ncbi:hypothetical protein JXB02_05950 [Candidatus Woesearchaeota archaeon]|nr:hypothetical protein [Candidatus Woesearchaeota archaeon]
MALSFLLLPAAAALTVSPAEAEIADIRLGEQYNFIVTVINTGDDQQQVQMTLGPYSRYLGEYLSLSPKEFTLGPGQKQNVQVIAAFPPTLSPEIHTLQILPMGADGSPEPFTLTFTVPGEQVHGLSLSSIEAYDITKEESLSITLRLQNRGNVIARGSPAITILRDGVPADAIVNKTYLMVMPQSDYNVTLLYDPGNLDVGEYTIEGQVAYNDGRQTGKAVSSFAILGEGDATTILGLKDKTILVGEVLEMALSLTHKEGTPYRVTATVAGTGVAASFASTMETAREEVEIVLETQNLPRGAYDLEVRIGYGTNYKYTIGKSVRLMVETRKNLMVQYGMLGGAILIVIGLLVGSLALKRRLKAPAGRTFVRELDLIDRRLGTAERSFDAAEATVNRLIAELEGFIGSSNDFLRSHFGDDYVFR